MGDVKWVPVVFAADCPDCELCGEPVCTACGLHYADCGCPGPHQEDEYEYKVIRKKLMAKPIDT